MADAFFLAVAVGIAGPLALASLAVSAVDLLLAALKQ